MIDLVHDTSEAELVLKCICKNVWGFEMLFIQFEGASRFFTAHEGFAELSRACQILESLFLLLPDTFV
jgi:hypothetical protein